MRHPVGERAISGRLEASEAAICCPKCLQVLTDPVVLRCGHAACAECAIGVAGRDRADPDKVKCVECGASELLETVVRCRPLALVSGKHAFQRQGLEAARLQLAAVRDRYANSES